MPFELDGFIPAQGAPAGAEFYNANRDAPFDPLVPALFEDTHDIVGEYLQFNRDSAEAFLATATETMELLSEARFPAELPDPPPAPTITSAFDAKLGLGFDGPPIDGELNPDPIERFWPNDVEVGEVGDAPIFESLGLTISVPPAPNFEQPSEPEEPGIDLDLEIPDAPPPSYGGLPDLDEIVIPSMPVTVLPVFGDEAPELSAVPPSPFAGWVEPQYASTMKDSVDGVVRSMLAGGTGLPEEIERAIWERASDREGVSAAARVNAAITMWAARGFPHVQGELNAQIVSVIGDETERKRNELSRERAIAAAELEQKNRQFAVEKGLAYEQIFLGSFLAVIDRNFQIAKFTVESEIQIYNARVSAFNVEQQVFTQKLELYKAKLEAALFYLKVYSAQVEAEKAKAEVNEAKVRSFEARVRAYESQVKAYGEVVRAATSRVELQRGKVDIYRAQIEAMIGKINGQRAAFEAYDARVRGETAKASLEELNVRAYDAKVRAFGQRSETAISKARIEVDLNKQRLEWNVANMQRITEATGQQLQVIQARLASHQAETQRALAKYGADKESKAAELQATVSMAQLAIAKYQALQRQWEVRAQQIISMSQINADSLRAAGQMAATIASGAMAGTHVSAGVSAGASAQQNASRTSTDNTSQSRTVSEENRYSVNHDYRHTV